MNLFSSDYSNHWGLDKKLEISRTLFFFPLLVPFRPREGLLGSGWGEVFKGPPSCISGCLLQDGLSQEARPLNSKGDEGQIQF